MSITSLASLFACAGYTSPRLEERWFLRRHVTDISATEPLRHWWKQRSRAEIWPYELETGGRDYLLAERSGALLYLSGISQPAGSRELDPPPIGSSRRM